jgi:hypothetical protein
MIYYMIYTIWIRSRKLETVMGMTCPNVLDRQRMLHSVSVRTYNIIYLNNNMIHDVLTPWKATGGKMTTQTQSIDISRPCITRSLWSKADRLTTDMLELSRQILWIVVYGTQNENASTTTTRSVKYIIMYNRDTKYIIFRRVK